MFLTTRPEENIARIEEGILGNCQGPEERGQLAERAFTRKQKQCQLGEGGEKQVGDAQTV